jgi:polysaccharide pyruvyl transferase WcaK-like protein
LPALRTKTEIVKRYLKPLAKRAWSSKAYASVLLASDRFAYHAGRLGYRQPSHPYSVLIAPSGRGNIGDQAMFDAFMANVDGRIAAVFGRSAALDVAESDRARTSVHVMPRLIRGMPVARFADVYRFGRLIRDAERLYIPGADTIDGGHPHASLARLNLAHLAHVAGIPSAIQGFSWAPDVPRSIVSSIRRLSGKTTLFPRDPLALRRLRASGVTESTQAADLVFSYDRIEPCDSPIELHLERLTDAGIPFVLVNASGMIARRMDLRDDYGHVIRHLHELGLAVVFLPHVLRDGDDDLIECAALYQQHGASVDLLVDQKLSPAQVKGLAARAFMSITGRMHLAIMSLSHTTPVLTMATVGKVEGLYELFGLARLVVDPRPGCAEDIIAKVDDVCAHRAAIASQIEAALPGIRSLSRRNFGGPILRPRRRRGHVHAGA